MPAGAPAAGSALSISPGHSWAAWQPRGERSSGRSPSVSIRRGTGQELLWCWDWHRQFIGFVPGWKTALYFTAIFISK